MTTPGGGGGGAGNGPGGGGGSGPPRVPGKRRAALTSSPPVGSALDSPADSTDTVIRLAKYLAQMEQRDRLIGIQAQLGLGYLLPVPTGLAERMFCQLL